VSFEEEEESAHVILHWKLLEAAEENNGKLK
jgi:hypothetical protein